MIYIDESEIITKKDIEHHKYFVIAILFTRNSKRIKRHFKKGIATLTQNAKYYPLVQLIDFVSKVVCIFI